MKILFLIFCFLLNGCNSLLYRQDLQQGNILTNEMTAQLHLGMTPEQVRFVMGNPVLVPSFDVNRWDYVYTFRKNSCPTKVERLTLYFEGGQLRKITGIEKYQIPS